MVTRLTQAVSTSKGLRRNRFESFEQFQEYIRTSFIEDSGIAPEIFEACVRFHQDQEFSDGGDVSIPIHDALDWHFTRFGKQAAEPLYAASLMNEDGTLWQVIVSIWDKNKQRPYKYFAPKDIGDKVFLPPVPPEIRRRISERYEIEIPEEGSFWEFIAGRPEFPRIVTEGAKKGLCSLSNGFIPITLYGCRCGVKTKDDQGQRLKKAQLKEDLAKFACKGSTWLFAFDRDTKEKAIKDVAAGKKKLAQALKAAGCVSADIIWDAEQGKGVDDFIINHGRGAFASVYNRALGSTQAEVERMAEESVEESVEDIDPKKLRVRWEQVNWDAPVSFNGQIGQWTEKTDKSGQPTRHFKPLCNFDFTVEREMQDSMGGGLVLLVKRSFEENVSRVILDSTVYTQVDKFTDTIKRELGTGISCNLTKFQLNALIHSKLYEYRINSGKVYKRIERYGQQEDGTWVFRDCQYKADGTLTNEEESGWIFASVGKDDFIPSPELAPEDPSALKDLIDASREFLGEKGIYSQYFTMGWVTAGLHSLEVFKAEGFFPLQNSYGPAGGAKTITSENALSLVGKNWADMGMLSSVSVSALYEHGSRTGSLPFIWDDPNRSPENEELFKSWYNWKPRKVRLNEQCPRSPLGITSNHVVGSEQAATFTRIIRNPHQDLPDGNKLAFRRMKEARKTASGVFPHLLALGYPKDEIALLENELAQHLRHAHARIAQGLAIVTWYAQKIVEMVGGSEDIKEWVIENCCRAENDTDNSADSLLDFISKIMALEAESLVGDWNLKREMERNEQKFYAIYAHDVWKLVDQRFKPATYNEKALKSLVLKAGGATDTTVRFSCDRDQTLAYYRATLTATENEDGTPLLLNAPKTLPRKAWLIPSHLFGESEESSVTENVTSVTECNQPPVTPQNNVESIVLDSINSKCNYVTEINEYHTHAHEKNNEVVGSPPLSSPSSSENNFSHKDDSSENSGYSGYSQLHQEKITQNQYFQPVTDSVTPPVTPGYEQLHGERATQNQASQTKTESVTPSVTSSYEQLHRGVKVRFEMAGSQRNGLTATVISVGTEFIKIRFHDQSLEKNLRIFDALPNQLKPME